MFRFLSSGISEGLKTCAELSEGHGVIGGLWRLQLLRDVSLTLGTTPVCVCVTVHGWQWRWWSCCSCCGCTSCWCCSAGRWQHWSRASFERRTEGAEATAEKGHGFNQTAGQGNSLIPAPASSLSAYPWQERRLRALRAKAGALTVADLQYLLARKLREWDCDYAPKGMLHPKGL